MDIRDRIIDFILDYYVQDKLREFTHVMDDVLDCIQKEDDNSVTIIYTGSSVEGMLNADDTDEMYQQSHFIVVERENCVPDNLKKLGVLVMDQSECHAGFTKLRLHNDPEFDKRHDIYTESNGKLYLNKDKYLKYACKDMMGHEAVTMHGPAILDSTGGIDIVICLSLPKWPTFEEEFLKRMQKCCFPLEEQLKEIMQRGFHIVCISHPLSKFSDIEFRFSFSMPEKILVKSLSNKQLKVYFLCKEVFRKYFKAETEDLQKGLPSYFAKTAIFWLAQTETKTFWEENTSIGCFVKVLNMVNEYLREKTFSNYFLPDNFMVDAYTSDQIKAIQERIEAVSLDTFGSILTCYTIRILGNNMDLLASIYFVVKKIGDEKRTCKILESILEEMQESFDVQSIVQNQKAISVKRDLCQFYMFDRLSKFMLFCQPDCFDNLNIPKALLIVSEKFYERVWQNGDYALRRYFEVCLQRTLAYYYLLGASRAKEFDESIKLSETARKLLIASQDVPGILNDFKTTANVSLGLLYYARNEWSLAAKVLNEALSSHADLVTNYPGSLIALPILLTGNRLRAPEFLGCDETLCELIERRHMHVVFLDPAVLATYIMVKIMSGKSPFDQHTRVAFANLKGYIEFTYENCAMFKSVIESYNYLSYKLGLADTNCSEKYQESVSCELCKNYYKLVT